MFHGKFTTDKIENQTRCDNLQVISKIKLKYCGAKKIGTDALCPFGAMSGSHIARHVFLRVYMTDMTDRGYFGGVPKKSVLFYE